MEKRPRVTDNEVSERSDTAQIRYLAFIAVLCPFVLVALTELSAILSRSLDGGPMRFPSLGGLLILAWIPGIPFIIAADRIVSPRAFHIGLALLAFAEMLLVLTFAGLAAMFGGSRGAIAGFAINVVLLGLFCGGIGFGIRRRKVRTEEP